MTKGYIHVYTGDGKGKTTAALGLTVRALGAGFKVLLVQFIKQQWCSEHKFFEKFSGQVEIRQYGRGFIAGRVPDKDEISEALEGLKETEKAMNTGEFDVVILDEVNVAVHLALIPVDTLLHFIDGKPVGVELILTGRNAHPEVIEKADLVTEMREIKHYMKKGVKARIGIEK